MEGFTEVEKRDLCNTFSNKDKPSCYIDSVLEKEKKKKNAQEKLFLNNNARGKICLDIDFNLNSFNISLWNISTSFYL